jgi:hypothetical protein
MSYMNLISGLQFSERYKVYQADEYNPPYFSKVHDNDV